MYGRGIGRVLTASIPISWPADASSVSIVAVAHTRKAGRIAPLPVHSAISAVWLAASDPTCDELTQGHIDPGSTFLAAAVLPCRRSW